MAVSQKKLPTPPLPRGTIAPVAPHKSRQVNQRYDQGLSLHQGLSLQTSDLNDDNGGEDDGIEEDVSTALVTRGDAAPIMQVAKDVFDAVSLPVEALIVGNRISRFLRGGMPRCLGPSRS